MWYLMYVLLLFAIHKEPEIKYILLGLFFAFSFFSLIIIPFIMLRIICDNDMNLLFELFSFHPTIYAFLFYEWIMRNSK